MKKVILSFSLFAFLACGNQKKSTENSTKTSSEVTTTVETSAPQVTKESTTEKSPLLAEGNISLADFKSGSNKAWFEPKYAAYAPSEALVTAFGEAMAKHDYRIDLYMGTWCHDSQRETPRLYKLLEMVDFDMSKLSVVSVNYSKKVPNVSPEVAEKLNIHHVPTIIFYENGKEVGRFVESARESLVQDLTKIASGEVYTDSYGG